MKVKVFADAHGAGRAAAREAARQLRERPGSVLGLATGHTMIPVYGELVRLHEEEGLSFKQAVTFNLDEYVGLGEGEQDSFCEFMKLRLTKQVDLAPGSFHIPNGLNMDTTAECRAYEKMIRDAGGMDLIILGLGRNGHIGFNEPGSPLNSRTRVVALLEVTRRTNDDDFRFVKETPREAITMGIATILEARRILLVVTGWEKAEILSRTLTSAPFPELPASFLHTHSDVTLIADGEAMEAYLEAVGDSGITFNVGPPA
ncbi:MAG TPA: glucosamine-6-phosphate deaminase [bacterium]|nr:glucosamine-6-phosphate deaminase [bacterium]